MSPDISMSKIGVGCEVLDLSNEDYHAHKAYSSSQLKLAHRNIELFKYNVIDKKGGFKSSPAMRLGTMFHEMVLEPEIFNPVVYPGAKLDKRTKAYKDFLLDNPCDPDNIITETDFQKLDQMRLNLESHPECPDFSETLNEASYFYKWQDHNLRVRPDCLDKENNVIYDIKTTSGPIDKNSFYHHMNKYDYDLSAAMYIHAMKAYCLRPWSFCFVVCQTVEPYSCALYWLGEDLFYQGFSKYKGALDKIKHAESFGSYAFQTKSEILHTFKKVEKFDGTSYYKLGKKQQLQKEILL
jgi:hypothetical protein